MNQTQGYHSSVGGPNQFFKGKMAGKVVRKGDADQRARLATNILIEQIDNLSEELFNVEQKEYVKNFI